MDNSALLDLYSGEAYRINDDISIRQPSPNEVRKYGERQYYQMIYTLCSVGADMKWQLWDMGKDYTEVPDFQLFSELLCRLYTQEQTKIIFGDLDFRQFDIVFDEDIDENIMLNKTNGVRIDNYVYRQIVDVLRAIHGLKRNNEIPGNNATKMFFIEEAREAFEESKDTEYKSMLLPLVSTLTVQYNGNYDMVMNMPLYTFTDNVRRVAKIKNSDLLLQSGYSGFGIDLKKINKDELNYMGDLQ